MAVRLSEPARRRGNAARGGPVTWRRESAARARVPELDIASPTLNRT